MLLEDSGSIGIETGEKVSKMEPSPKRRKLDVSWRQERNRLAPVFRFLETADNSTTDDDTDSISSDHPAINNEEERATLHIGSYSNQDNQEPALNEEETCAGVLHEEVSSELEIDNDYESVDSYESCSDNSYSDSEIDSLCEDECIQNEEFVEMDSDYYEGLMNPLLEIDGSKELEQFLGSWVNRFNIPHSASNALLKGLSLIHQKKQNGTFDNIPIDARTLLKTPRSVLLDGVAGGKYLAFWVTRKNT